MCGIVGIVSNKFVVNHLVDELKSLEQTQPIVIATVLHLFAYYMAITLGRNVDRPRNLAKSVTVE